MKYQIPVVLVTTDQNEVLGLRPKIAEIVRARRYKRIDKRIGDLKIESGFCFFKSHNANIRPSKVLLNIKLTDLEAEPPNRKVL
jgi:hypothetical protein